MTLAIALSGCSDKPPTYDGFMDWEAVDWRHAVTLRYETDFGLAITDFGQRKLARC